MFVELIVLLCFFYCRLVEDLLKDINNMLNDFFIELDFMFEWIEKYIWLIYGKCGFYDCLEEICEWVVIFM